MPKLTQRKHGSCALFSSPPLPAACSATGINNEGVAVGLHIDTAGLSHGLYSTPATGAWTTVDDPNGVGGTVVNGISNAGVLVGFYTDAGNTLGMLVIVTK